VHKRTTKDEYVVFLIALILCSVYRIIDDFTNIHISGRFIVILLMVIAGYLLFNRQVKFLINKKRNYGFYYNSFAIVDEVKYEKIALGVAKSKYIVFVLKYTIGENKFWHKEIHSSFSFYKWKKGHSIALKINRKNPDDIIIPKSDTFMFFFYCAIGIATEMILLLLFVNVN